MRLPPFCYYKKQTDVSFSCVCPAIDNEFHHNIVKVVCGSTRLSDPLISVILSVCLPSVSLYVCLPSLSSLVDRSVCVPACPLTAFLLVCLSVCLSV